MERDYTQEHKYLLAKKKVEKIKGFYWHLAAYIAVNIFISTVIVIGLTTEENKSFVEAITHFGVYATWLFWGIGLFFHWLGTFGTNIFFNKDWENRKIEEYIKEFDEKRR
ncbi:2TM domain-containing protein [Tenacibaculum aiptasiae]|uniref:2TM domain-containing protein n=1 Tax=Tenacibaculum aiptasiae TaxID=426481 RepID=UPI00232CA522|nr:2TM domain-containing protein [Tenacibaculum aiptasiae]